MPTTAPIKLSDVIVTYRRVPAVHHVSGTFEPGSLTAIVGSNGAGKSTLLKALMGLIPLSDGRIDRGGLKPSEFAYLPQRPEIDRTFPITVLQTVQLGAWPKSGAFGAVPLSECDRAMHCIERVGLSGYAETPIAALSVGQWQRALFARLIMQNARVILLDEPFSAVDERTTNDLMSLIREWHGEGRTVIAVLHELDFVRHNFPRALLIAREAVAWNDAATALSHENLDRARMMTDRWARDTHDHAHHDHGH